MDAQVKPSTKSAYSTITSCRACHSSSLTKVLHLGDQYLVNFVREKNPLLPRAPLELMQCECGLLQLRDTVDPDLLFREFWYRTGVNQSMRAAMQDLVRDGIKYHDEGTWVDIGANDGYLLSQVPNSFTKIAFEPALNFASDIEEHADLAISDYFSANYDRLTHKGQGVCDVITSAAMFYDLDDPHAFLADIAKCLSERGVWINQLNDSPTMLRQNAWDAICHEHLCYYDVHTLESMYAKHGLKIVNIAYNDVNGGSVRVTASKSGYGIPLVGHRKVSSQDSYDFAERVRKWKELMGWIMDSIHLSGRRVWGYGASTKGCVLLQYLDRNFQIHAIADRNPLKHGTIMAGTWLPVTDEETMRKERPDLALVLPWAFRDEFIERERELRNSGTTFLFPLPNPEYVL